MGKVGGETTCIVCNVFHDWSRGQKNVALSVISITLNRIQVIFEISAVYLISYAVAMQRVLASSKNAQGSTSIVTL